VPRTSQPCNLALVFNGEGPLSNPPSVVWSGLRTSPQYVAVQAVLNSTPVLVRLGCHLSPQMSLELISGETEYLRQAL